MASRIFGKAVGRRLVAGTSFAGAAAYSTIKLQDTSGRDGNDVTITPAEAQFSTSSLHPIPAGWSAGTWKIRNDYPQVQSRSESSPTLPGPTIPSLDGDLSQEAPWLQVDFRSNPSLYIGLIKEYCWEGNVNNGFVVQKNTVRQWYHAPWMHYGTTGREPLNGLTFERATPPKEFSASQNRVLQTWACGYYNAIGATIFGALWADKNKPDWTKDYKFPLGTCVFKILLTDASDEEVPILKGAPSLPAVIATRPSDPKKTPDPTVRNNFASNLRLLQCDVAVRDDRSPTGWVFGTFMFDGSRNDRNPWDRIIPVGLMWGNDPQMNQVAFEGGATPTESWINPEAESLRKSLGGLRPSWGWNNRLNGPADNFISSCTSCHSVSQRDTAVSMTQPRPKNVGGKWIPVDDTKTMNWFRNIPAGKSFSPNDVSGDYSLQLMIGYHNYQAWQNTQRSLVSSLFHRTKYVFPGMGTMPGGPEKTGALRHGPQMDYESSEREE